MLDFNSADLSESVLNVRINQLIEAQAPPPENTRLYLGASSIGSECSRKIQFDWWLKSKHPVLDLDRFERGHFFEALSRDRLRAAGFKFEPDASKLEFIAIDGYFRGHADGLLIAGPPVQGLTYPCIWEHKAVKAKNWRELDRVGLLKKYMPYAAQVWMYQFYLKHTNPAFFTFVNSDTCERLHFLLPFDAAYAEFWTERAAAIIKATQAGELMDRGHKAPSDWRCKCCGHTERCWKHSPPQPERFDWEDALRGKQP
jgi:hypothetical protein